MARLITFSRVFPAYHPRKGEPTNFVEQIYNSIFEEDCDWSDAPGGPEAYVIEMNHSVVTLKHHTIRNGNRWKVGDKFSPRVWSGKPYASKMITIAPDIEIKKIWDFEIKGDSIYIDGRSISPDNLEEVAENDGLSRHELQEWFQYPKPFKGQIICWSDSINY